MHLYAFNTKILYGLLLITITLFAKNNPDPNDIIIKLPEIPKVNVDIAKPVTPVKAAVIPKVITQKSGTISTKKTISKDEYEEYQKLKALHHKQK